VDRGRKVSVSGVSVSPNTYHLGFSLATEPDGFATAEKVVEYLRDLLRHLRGERHRRLGPRRQPQGTGDPPVPDQEPSAAPGDAAGVDLRIECGLDVMAGSSYGQDERESLTSKPTGTSGSLPGITQSMG
jgi:hypothetical protein